MENNYNRCICGKLFSFKTSDEARNFIYARNPKLRRQLREVVRCKELEGVYHVTSKPGSMISRLEREMQREMASVRSMVIDFIKVKYSSTGEYKCTTAEIKKALDKKTDGIYSTGTISAAVSQLKKDGTITELEKVENSKGGRPSYHFTLTEILDEVTNPKPGSKEVSMEKSSSVPSQTSKAPVPTNPLDKVNSQLETIKSIVTGMASGYAQLVEHAQAQRKAIEDFNNTSATDESQLLNLLSEIKEIASSHVTVDGDKLADVINARLANLKFDDSFIYRIREELDDQTTKTNTGLENLFTQQKYYFDETLRNIKVPSSVANSDDYRAGIKEGIRLAVEMGLVIRD